MREFRQRQIVRERLYSIPALILFAVITILLARGAYQVVEKERSSETGLAALALQTADLKEQKIKLQNEETALGTDAGIDAEIKDKFNVSAAGEHVAIIVDRKVEATDTSTTTPPWYKRLWSAIMP